MKICDKKERELPDELPDLLGGHIYSFVGVSQYSGALFVYCPHNETLVNLEDGRIWASEGFGNPFGRGRVMYEWKDVTDEYCLKKVSP